ncbi:unnamed protein product [Protopolystoma xenopodis]|uniref:Uncharacterized protein n=1 Tax=Protopolystoma xenopodis TaxID=117903 RepID=A0A3S5CP13_9PLAT|nr:unnamed protein product [Protopolystoma xenopodis]
MLTAVWNRPLELPDGLPIQYRIQISFEDTRIWNFEVANTSDEHLEVPLPLVYGCKTQMLRVTPHIDGNIGQTTVLSYLERPGEED